MSHDRTAVLVVDDVPANLLAVEAVLEPLELDVVTVGSGEEALRRLLHVTFAVILLDIQMPELDGFATARLIKARARTRSIPIIFLTALDRDLDHELEGYGTGAVDYLTKPFDPQVLRSKVAVFVDLHRQANLIEAQHLELAERLIERDRAEAALRAQAAELARSNAELERFAAVAAHELQEPLDVISGLVEVARLRLPAGSPPEPALALEEAGAALGEVRAELDSLLAYAEAGTTPLHVVPVDLDDLLAELVREDAARLDAIGATVTNDPLPVILADRWQIGLVLANLLDNAVRFRSDEPLEVHVGLSRDGADWVLSVRDNGIGIEPAAIPTLFTAFGAKGGEGGTASVGLGLCCRIVQRHGGAIDVDSVVGQGTTLSVRLPAGSGEP